MNKCLICGNKELIYNIERDSFLCNKCGHEQKQVKPNKWIIKQKKVGTKMNIYICIIITLITIIYTFICPLIVLIIAIIGIWNTYVLMNK